MPKNLSGGKSFKKQGSKVRRGERQNNEITEAFVEDVENGEVPAKLVIARVAKMLGSGRVQLVLPQNGEVITASIRGTLTMSSGAARAPDNKLAILLNGFILLHMEDYGAQIVGVLTRDQIDRVKSIVVASRGFFSAGDATEEDDGFDWDVEEAVVAPVAPIAYREKKAERNVIVDDGDVNIDEI